VRPKRFNAGAIPPDLAAACPRVTWCGRCSCGGASCCRYPSASRRPASSRPRELPAL